MMLAPSPIVLSEQDKASGRVRLSRFRKCSILRAPSTLAWWLVQADRPHLSCAADFPSYSCWGQIPDHRFGLRSPGLRPASSLQPDSDFRELETGGTRLSYRRD